MRLSESQRVKSEGIGGFYAEHVHDHMMADPSAALEKYRRRVVHELASFDIRPEQIRNKIILDVGTGFQALIFCEMGCKHVFHVDASRRQVEWLKAYSAEKGISNITSECHDITDQLGPVTDFDLAFVVGVYHHLRTPGRFLTRLLERGHSGSILLLRCYRSGTWSRWLVAHLRTLSGLTDVDTVKGVFRTLFPLEENSQFLMDMIDDLFVSEWGCLHPGQFQRDAGKFGLKFHSPESGEILSFEDRDENFRLSLELTDQTVVPDDPKDLESSFFIDQVGLDIRNNEFSRNWQNFAASLPRFSLTERTLRLITLYRLGRRMQQMDYFLLKNQMKVPEKGKLLGEQRIQTLVNILKLWQREML